WYYQPREESAENLALMRAVDDLYTRWPFYGVRRMSLALQGQGWAVNPKRTRRLMRRMGLEAIYPKPHLSFNGRTAALKRCRLRRYIKQPYQTPTKGSAERRPVFPAPFEGKFPSKKPIEPVQTMGSTSGA